MERSGRPAGGLGIEACRIVVDVLPERDEQPAALDRFRIHLVARRHDRRAGGGEKDGESKLLLEPRPRTKARERERDAGDDRGGGEVDEDVRCIAQNPLIVHRQATIPRRLPDRGQSLRGRDRHGVVSTLPACFG